MLFNPNWVSKNPLTVTSLIAWLEKQPLDEHYSYTDNSRCLLAQYLKAMGYKGVSVGGRYFRGDRSWFRATISALSTQHKIPTDLHDIAMGDGYHHTFGAALQRAHRYQKFGTLL